MWTLIACVFFFIATLVNAVYWISRDHAADDAINTPPSKDWEDALRKAWIRAEIREMKRNIRSKRREINK